MQDHEHVLRRVFEARRGDPELAQGGADHRRVVGVDAAEGGAEPIEGESVGHREGVLGRLGTDP